MLNNMSTTQVRVLGLVLTAAVAAGMAASFEAGKRITRRKYIKQINIMETAHLRTIQRAKGGYTSEPPVQTVAAEPKVGNEDVSSVITGETLTTGGVADTATSADTLNRLPVDGLLGNKPHVIIAISDDLTSDNYTSPGINLDEANKIINGELTVGDGTRFECPEGGLWVAGRMVMGSAEDLVFHKAAVESALLANTPKKKKRLSASERRERDQQREVSKKLVVEE